MCDCAKSRAWDAYWTEEAIAERLDAEVRLYRRICHERWQAAMNDVRGDARMSNAPTPPRAEPFAVLEARRAVPGDWPPRKV